MLSTPPSAPGSEASVRLLALEPRASPRRLAFLKKKVYETPALVSSKTSDQTRFTTSPNSPYTCNVPPTFPQNSLTSSLQSHGSSTFTESPPGKTIRRCNLHLLDTSRELKLDVARPGTIFGAPSLDWRREEATPFLSLSNVFNIPVGSEVTTKCSYLCFAVAVQRFGYNLLGIAAIIRVKAPLQSPYRSTDQDVSG